MRRTVLIGLVVVFVLMAAGFVFPFVSKLRQGQQVMADDIQKIVAEIKTINATQQELLEKKQDAQVLEINGRAYLSDPSKPASGAEIQLLQLPGMEIIRRIAIADNGSFTSGALPPGEYALFGKLQNNNWGTFSVQSRPIRLYSGGNAGDVDLDLRFHAGQVSFNLPKALPRSLKFTHYDSFDESSRREENISCCLNLSVISELRGLPLSPARTNLTTIDWPLVGRKSHGDPVYFSARVGPDVGKSLVSLDRSAMYHRDSDILPADLKHAVLWPAGKYQISASLGFVPSGGGSMSFGFGHSTTVDRDKWVDSCEVDVRDGMQVNIRVDVSEQLGPLLQELIENRNYFVKSGACQGL